MFGKKKKQGSPSSTNTRNTAPADPSAHGHGPQGQDELADMRRDYDAEPFLERSASEDPVEQFRDWFSDAKAQHGHDANAMTLSTASSAGEPDARIVLLKGLDDQGGFVFYTNYNSAKAQHLAENPRAALVFYWSKLNRQVRVAGAVTKTDRATSEQYFTSRPKLSQFAAAASDQSSELTSRDALFDRFKTLRDQWEGQAIPCPEDWGGFVLKAERLEFWQGQPSRMHDRLVYTRQAEGWSRTRLSP